MDKYQRFHIKPDWENINVTSINRENAHMLWHAYKNRKAAIERDADQSFKFSLAGECRFKLFSRPEDADDFYMPEYDDSGFARLRIPGNWELSGHGEPIYTNYVYPWSYNERGRWLIQPKRGGEQVPNPPYIPSENPTGCYRIKFTIPPDFAKRDYFLQLDGIETAYYLWVNGKSVGYAQDSKLPSVFDISDAAQVGENLLALQVMRFADSSYIEDQDYWHLSGIFRNVWLVAKPRLRIEDMKLIALPNLSTGGGEVMADVRVTRVRGFGDARVTAELFDGDHVLIAAGEACPAIKAEYRDDVNPTANTARIRLKVKNAVLWSPETPVLYNVVVTLYSENGEMLDCESERAGFKLVDVINGVVYLNGTRLIVRGVNRHEFCPEHGRAVSVERMREEIRLMKRLNINAVRTCHYPDSPEWYALCDEMGLLVLCECNLESHGVMGALSHDPAWAMNYLERAMRMVCTYKNHVSIYAWSLGNESGKGVNHAAMYGFVKEYDKTRLCQYESGQPEKNMSDVRGDMYASVKQIHGLLGNPADCRPVILVEYLYQIRNSGGGLEHFCELLERFPRFQGGFVWDWQDKALIRLTENGEPYFAHGGDFHESYTDPEVPLHMTNNGIVLADLRPKPVAYELKQAYAPVYVEQCTALGAWFTIPPENKYRLVNRCLARSTLDFRCEALLRENGEVIAVAEICLPDVPPMCEGEFEFTFPHEKKAGCEYHIEFQIYDANDKSSEEEVSFRQFCLESGPIAQPAVIAPQHVRSSTKNGICVVQNNSLRITLNLADGGLHLEKDGRSYLENGIIPCCNRPFSGLDASDRNWGWHGLLRPYRESSCEKGETRIFASESFWRAEAPFSMRNASGVWAVGQIIYMLLPNGLRVGYEISVMPSCHALPRAGVEIVLPAFFEELSYFGLDGETYPDRKMAGRLGVHTSTVAAQHFPYAPPSENGGHEETRWLELKSADGRALRIESARLFHFDIHHNMVEDYIKADHDHELPKRTESWLHIDVAHSPIGSDMAWSTSMPQENRIGGGHYSMDFDLLLT